MLLASLDVYYLELWDVEKNVFLYEYTNPEAPDSDLGGQELSIDFSVSPNGDIYILTGYLMDLECVWSDNPNVPHKLSGISLGRKTGTCKSRYFAFLQLVRPSSQCIVGLAGTLGVLSRSH